MPREERQSRARRSDAEKPVLTLDVREDGRVKCPVCEQIVSTDEEKQRISKHISLQLGVVCPYSDRAFKAGGLPEVRQGFRSRAGEVARRGKRLDASQKRIGFAAPRN